tara:strand:+ start:158 stop:721 length:564 start_codon:yes stop_codon:yes gene_type:complete
MRKIIVIIIAFIFLSLNAYADSSVIYIKKNNDGSRNFDIEFEFNSSNNLRKNFNLLTDYENIYRFNPSLVKVEILSKDINRVEVKNTFKNCILFFCREMIMYESILSYCVNNSYCIINAQVIPNSESPVTSGKTSWIIRHSNNSKSKIIYRSEFLAYISLPPFIGESIFKKTINSNLNYLEESLNNF